MSITFIISFTGFAIVALGLAFTGVSYMSASRIMPYHLQAMGSTWEALPEGVRIMSLNFMKGAADGFIATSVAIVFLLVFPFRYGEPWARWALVAVSLTKIGLTLLRVRNVRAKTPGRPSLVPLTAMGVAALIGFAFSFVR